MSESENKSKRGKEREREKNAHKNVVLTKHTYHKRRHLIFFFFSFYEIAVFSGVNQVINVFFNTCQKKKTTNKQRTNNNVLSTSVKECCAAALQNGTALLAIWFSYLVILWLRSSNWKLFYVQSFNFNPFFLFILRTFHIDQNR